MAREVSHAMWRLEKGFAVATSAFTPESGIQFRLNYTGKIRTNSNGACASTTTNGSKYAASVQPPTPAALVA